MPQPPAYLASYSSLQELGKLLDSLSPAPTGSSTDSAPSDSAPSDDAALRATVGLLSLGLYDLSEVGRFTTNRYFQDAMGIETLPSPTQLLDQLASGSAQLTELAAKYGKHLPRPAKSDIEAYESHFRELKGSGDNSKVPGDLLDAIFALTQACFEMLRQKGAASELVPPHPLFTAESKRQLAENGYAIIEGVLDDDKVAAIRDLVVRIARYEMESDCAYLYGGSRQLQRIYNLLNKHQIFIDLIQHPLVLQAMDHLFQRPTLHDKYVLASWHASLIGGGGAAQMLHVDSAVEEPLPPWMIRANINFMLDDFTLENGATMCLPGSHLYLKKPSRDDQNRPDLKPITGPKGSLAIWTGHLWHRSGENKTDRDRIALLGCFAASHLREMCMEEDHLRIIDREVVDDMSPTLKRLIGAEHGVKTGAQCKPPAFDLKL